MTKRCGRLTSRTAFALMWVSSLIRRSISAVVNGLRIEALALHEQRMTVDIDIPPVAAVPASHAHRLYIGGVVISSFYVVGLALYSASVWAAMLRMKPDEFATFLSGIFAPLAFLWLVLGFRQQGDELQNSARALWLQGEELRNSVEQQRQLVEVSREQLTSEIADRTRIEEEAERSAQPHFIFARPGGSYSGPHRSLRLVVTCGGPTCSDVRMTVGGEFVASSPVLGEGATVQTLKDFDTPEAVTPLVVMLEYTDRRGGRRRQEFHVPVAETGGPNGDRTLGDPVHVGGVEKI